MAIDSTTVTTENITGIGLSLWETAVEKYNPDFFYSVNRSLFEHDYKGDMDREVFLYETNDAYLHLLIGKLVQAKTTPDQNRTLIYQNFTEIGDKILERLQLALDYDVTERENELIKPLKHIQRNLIFRMSSKDTKHLILYQKYPDQDNPDDSSSFMGEIGSPDMVLSRITKIPLYIFIAAGIFCLFFSTLFHTAYWYGDNTYHNLSRLDYGGIALLIAGSVIPPYFYIFCCPENKKFAYGYSIFITVVWLCVFAATMLPQMSSQKMKPVRTIIYLVAGVCAGLPFFHYYFASSLYVYPLNKFYWGMGWLLYVIGAILYAVRFPERLFPKTFDYFGNSHNLFHCLVVIAAWFHFMGALSTYHGRQVLSC